MADQIATLVEWKKRLVRAEEKLPGFWERHPLRAMGRLDGGYQFGYEIGGYGTVVGYCTQHKPHKTEAEAEECGRRFLAGEPHRPVERMLWRIKTGGREQ